MTAFRDATQVLIDRWKVNLLSSVPSARIVDLPGAGHYVFLTRQASCIMEIRLFIAAVAGIALGLAGGWGAAVWLRSMVYRVPERSSLTMLFAVLAVMAIASIAAGLPVWRATRVDVNKNLREA